VIDQMRQKLRLNAAAVQVPIGSEQDIKGVVDLVNWKAYYNTGEKGEVIETREVPAEVVEFAKQKQLELIQHVAEADEQMADLFLMEETPTSEQLTEAIRRSTVARTFCPVFMGSAYWNTGVQPMLDGVNLYLPAPHQVVNTALDLANNEEKVDLGSSSVDPLVALAFKLEEGRFGQLTYLRVYQGTLKRGQWIVNTKNGKKIKVPRLVRMHSNDMEDVQEIGSGEICALFGVECSSGDTFTDGQSDLAMVPLFVYG
jgi:elongation factor G